jgi:hypothetical protein
MGTHDKAPDIQLKEDQSHPRTWRVAEIVFISGTHQCFGLKREENHPTLPTALSPRTNFIRSAIAQEKNTTEGSKQLEKHQQCKSEEHTGTPWQQEKTQNQFEL